MTNTKALREEIEKSGIKYKHIAESLGLSRYGLQRKIENDSEFKAGEIAGICSLLGIQADQRDKIFFYLDCRF